MNKLFKKIKRSPNPRIVERTNTIQYDDMGYPLRLIKMSDGKYQWLDTHEDVGDVAISPDKVLKLNAKLFK